MKMPKYLLVYHGGTMPSTPEEGEKVMKAWGEWIGATGKALVDVGNPVGMSKTVASNGKVSDGGGSNPTMGYSIIEAKTIDEAAKLSQGCPQLTAGGSIEIAEIIPM
jgi:hypothetical protein